MNVDHNVEKSIIMKKRENKSNDVVKTKIVDNQMFDLDGNVLQSLKNSFNQSIIGSVNSKIGSDFTQSVVGNHLHGGAGP